MSRFTFAVSGEKNSGKTTLIERLLPALQSRHFSVAVIKHDGHSFEPDVPGTDSRRFLDAGAVGTAVYDGEKYMLVRRDAIDERFLAACFPEVDFIVLEGLKHSRWPKLLLAENTVLCSWNGKRYERDDIAALAEEIAAYAAEVERSK